MAVYNGDGLYAPTVSPCGAPNEQSEVTPAEPFITTQAPPSAPVGSPISDQATLSGGVNPTGSITFTAYGPNDATCAGPPAFSSTVPVNGNGSYSSAAFTPTTPGTYRWIARYSGDTNNTPAAGACGEPNEQTEVFGPPAISVEKTAAPTSRLEPGGNFTFDVVVTNTGPNALTITSLTDSVHGNVATKGTCTNAVGRVLAPDPDGSGPALGGTYSCSFIAEFTGPGGSSETNVVTVVGVDEYGQQATDDDDATVTITNVPPAIGVDLTVAPTTKPAPGGAFSFRVTVTNSSGEAVTITSLADNVYGNLATRGTCANAIGSIIPANGTYSCSFTGEFSGGEGASQTNTVTARAVDDDGSSASGSDDATLTLTTATATSSSRSQQAPAGYWLVGSDGGVFTFGNVGFFGSTGDFVLNRAIVGMAATPSGNGYWLVASDGGVFAFGDAGFFGSTGDLRLNQPVIAMAATPSGNGYWLMASDGGVFAFGDAGYFGSTGGLGLNHPIVDIMTTPSGQGYWLVAADGELFMLGDAEFFGSTGRVPLSRPIGGATVTPSGQGYWIVDSAGTVFAFGDARSFGNASGLDLTGPIVSIRGTRTGQGYWLLGSDGGVFSFGDAQFFGSTGDIRLDRPIVTFAAR